MDCAIPEGVVVLPTWIVAAVIVLLALTLLASTLLFIGWLDARQPKSCPRCSSTGHRAQVRLLRSPSGDDSGAA